MTNPITAGPNGGDFVWRRILPRVSHEGLAFDTHRALYFIDELNGGSIYKFVSANPDATDLAIDAEGNIYIVEIGAAARTTTSGSPPTGTRTATSSIPEKDWRAGRRTARPDPNSPASTSTSATRTGRSSTFSIPPAGSIG